MKNNTSMIIKSLIFLLMIGCTEKKEESLTNTVNLINNEEEQKVDVLIDGQLFTSYIYSDNISVLKKPVLYPLITSSGMAVTRGYPLDPRPKERTDHPHHIGAWLNYGDVNSLDFWNNSDAISEDRKNDMGTIRHNEILQMGEGHAMGELAVSANWLKPNGEVILEEKSEFIFYSNNNERFIDRTTTLTAIKEQVLFKDNKEGMIGIRMARQLELPSDKPVTLSDSHGNKTDVPVLDNSGVSGNYLNSDGIEGMEVWGKRAKWVSLYGNIEDKEVSVVIMDNPNNVGYPTYWHARGYGLFAANPLGQKVFSEGKEELNFSLKVGESVTFTYRILILDGKTDKTDIESRYQDFIESN